MHQPTMCRRGFNLLFNKTPAHVLLCIFLYFPPIKSIISATKQKKKQQG